MNRPIETVIKSLIFWLSYSWSQESIFYEILGSFKILGLRFCLQFSIWLTVTYLFYVDKALSQDTCRSTCKALKKSYRKGPCTKERQNRVCDVRYWGIAVCPSFVMTCQNLYSQVRSVCRKCSPFAVYNFFYSLFVKWIIVKPKFWSFRFNRCFIN